MALPPWKLDLQPASFNGAEFHVEINSRTGGRRNANHQFPKKNIPYDEDMGRRSRTFIITGYVIGPDYQVDRDALIAQLEVETNGTLILPTSTESQTVVCDRFSVVERRERGGYAEFEMAFNEAGQDPSANSFTDTASATNAAADDAQSSIVNSSDIETIST